MRTAQLEGGAAAALAHGYPASTTARRRTPPATPHLIPACLSGATLAIPPIVRRPPGRAVLPIQPPPRGPCRRVVVALTPLHCITYTRAGLIRPRRLSFLCLSFLSPNSP